MDRFIAPITFSGKNGTFHADVSRSDSAVTKSQSLTNQDGQTRQRNVYRTRQSNTYTRQIQVSGPDGQTGGSVQKGTVDAQ